MVAELSGVSCRWDDATPSDVGGLILMPGPGSAEIVLAALQWLRESGRSLRQNRGVIRLVLSEVATPNARAVAGLVKTAAHEWPEVDVRVVDAGSLGDSIEIAAECRLVGPRETVWDRGWHAKHLIDSPQSDEPPLDLAAGSLVVVTGGARGVTAECAIRLAERYRPTLLLLGRSPLPQEEPAWLSSLTTAADIKKALFSHAPGPRTPKQIEGEYQHVLAGREIHGNLARLRNLGVTVEYVAVDVRDATQVAQVIRGARQSHGPVRGLIHGSGVLADKLLLDKTDEQFRTVYDTKVKGWESLVAATEPDPLAFAVLFSSSTGRFGRSGQGDYAAANEYLNAAARVLRRARPGCRSVALNWGPWDGGMVTPALRGLFASEGIGLIPQQSGGAFMVAELSSAGPAEIVVLGPPPDVATTFSIDCEHMPALADHVLDQRAVLPVALALELMAEVASRRLPDRQVESVRDLRVLKAVIAPTQATVRCAAPQQRDRGWDVPVSIESEGRVCYRATVGLQPGVRWGDPVTANELPPDPCYHEELFHGPRWQMIDRVNRCDEAGIEVSAQIGVQPADWMPAAGLRSWHVQPQLVDAVLQAIIIWTQRRLKLPSLPTSIGHVKVLGVIPNGRMVITVVVGAVNGASVKARATASDAHGRPWVEFDGIEFICAERLRTAFAQRRLAVTA